MLAIPQGLEPRTVCLEGRCSILLSYGTKLGCVQARAQRCAAFSFTQCQSMKKGRGSSSPLFRGPMERPAITDCCRQCSFSQVCLCSFSCPFWTSCQLQQKHPWSNIRQKQTCCRTRPWCPLTLKRLWSSNRQTWTCRMTLFRQWKPRRLWRSIRQTWTCRSWPSCHPWSRFALFWLFCGVGPLWTVRTRSMRGRRMRRGRGTFSLWC